MSYDYNPRRTATDREGIIGIMEQGRINSVIITADLSSTGRSALQKFLRYYVQDKYGAGPLLVEWSAKAEALLRRVSALKQDPVLTAEAHQTLSGQPEAMYIRWNYFDWHVEPKEGVRVHPYDKQVAKRIIDAGLEEHARTFVPLQMSTRL